MTAAFSFLRAHWALIAVAALLALLAAGFLGGYRIGAGFTLVRSGSVAVAGLPAGTDLYFDLSRLQTVGALGATSLRLTPGQHTVIVDADGFQPWDELFSVESATTTMLRPILVPVEVKAVELVGAAKTEAARVIKASALPTKAKPLVTAGGCAAVYASAGKVVAEATTTPGASCEAPAFLCEEGVCAPTIVHAPAEALRSVLPYPGRDDALVIAAGGLIYVVELDPREPQFFAPLFKGAYAAAASWSPSSIAGTDNLRAFEIPLR